MKKAGTKVPALSSHVSLFSEKDLTLLFLLRRLFRFLLGGLLFGLRLFCLFLRSGFLLRRFLGRLLRRRFGRRLWGGRLFLGLLADDHQLLFLSPRQFLVVFQP